MWVFVVELSSDVIFFLRQTANRLSDPDTMAISALERFARRAAKSKFKLKVCFVSSDDVTCYYESVNRLSFIRAAACREIAGPLSCEALQLDIVC